MEREKSGQGWALGLFLIAFLLGVAYVIWLSAGASATDPAGPASPGVSAAVAASRTPQPTAAQRPTRTARALPTPSPTPRAPKVGIVAGHWKSDSGAVCPDGLQEVMINLDVAARVVAILQDEGYDAELLPEFAEELDGYVADAFVSIHADSCEVAGASGFKVARVAASAIPEEEDRLVACLVGEYGRATGLAFHKNSITFDMTGYHAFGEIHPQTPAAIIELGFMGEDRALLTDKGYEMARGIARGVACFVEGW